jgi:outer membrane receptor protein involved in Fe transport
MATVQYRFTPNDMVYVTAAKGFRAGGVNTPLNPTDCDPGLAQYGLSISDIPKSFGPDEVWSYELGTKLRLLDNRMQLNLSAFQINWNDIQTSIRPPSGCNTGWTQNGAKAISRGANLQVEYQPVRQLDFDLTMSYVDAFYPDSVLGPQPLSGAPASILISQGAKFSIPPLTGHLGIRYDFHLLGHDDFVRTDWQYSGSYQSGSDYGAATYSPYRSVPAWFLLNVRAGVNFGWGDAQLYSTNVLNRQAWQNPQNAAGLSSFGDSGCLASGGPSCSQFIGFTPFVAAQVPTPRVVGIQVNYRF